MTTVFKRFDPERMAVINPEDGIVPIPDFPKVCVSTFSEKILDRYIAMEGVEKIGFLIAAGANVPVYKIAYEGAEIAFYLSRVGAPAAAAGLEEIIALGAKAFVLFGTCGVLDRRIPDGGIIVPTAALRDEGTSYHYVEASDEIEADPRGLEAVDRHTGRARIDAYPGENLDDGRVLS